MIVGKSTYLQMKVLTSVDIFVIAKVFISAFAAIERARLVVQCKPRKPPATRVKQ
jgi:hypothetical protein